MLQVLFAWFFIFGFSFATGILVQALMVPHSHSNSFLFTELCGVCVLVVYAQFYSIFAPVKSVYALSLLMALIVIAGLVFRGKLKKYWNNRYQGSLLEKIKKTQASSFTTITTVICLCTFSLWVLNRTSSMPTYFDDYNYHLPAIRWIEEYGVVPGIGLINSRIGFNSSLFSLFALFGFKDVFGETIHATSGGIAVIILIGISDNFLKKKDFFPFLVLLAAMFYIHENETQGFYTDFLANLIFMAVVLLWVQSINAFDRANLCMILVCVVTMKVSFAVLLLMALYPIAELLKGKRKYLLNILGYIGIAFLIALPFFIRNYYISGWLLYPLKAIDIFNPDWKVPIQTLQQEVIDITAWGRFPGDGYEMTLDMPLLEWVKIWWNITCPITVNARRTIILALIAITLYAIAFTVKIDRELKNRKSLAPGSGAETLSKVDYSMDWLYLCMIIEIIYWFFGGPNIRFIKGVFYCVIIVSFSNIECIIRNLRIIKAGHYNPPKFYSMVEGILLLVLTAAVIKGTYMDWNSDSLIIQEPYAEIETEAYDIGNGLEVYYSTTGSQAGYYAFPSTTDKELLYNIVPRGDSFKDGFKLANN